MKTIFKAVPSLAKETLILSSKLLERPIILTSLMAISIVREIPVINILAEYK